ASRIDRRADRDKDVLQAAAVVGRDVPIELLRTVVDLPASELAASLERLSTAELLGPAESPGERAFRHPLAQEVAYRTQLLDRRRRTHAAVARALLALHGSAAPTHSALLAHHYEEAGERLEAARWHERAGRRVARGDPADGAAELEEGSDDAVLAFEMHTVLAHAQLAVGRLHPARAIAARALAELARDAELLEALGRSTAPGFCRIWWAVASAYLGKAED